MKTTAFLLSLMIPLLSNAAQISEDFSSIDQKGTVTGVWNLALGQLTPHFRIVNYGGGASSANFTVGDGSDGVFDVSTYANFSVNGDLSGNIIRLDQTRFPQLNVTNFNLAAGWYLEPANNLPFEIYSQQDVIINGEIWCHGRNGTSAGVAGTGRCGGADGGAGGANPGGAGSPGNGITGGPSGGGAGGANSGGGGGGGYSVPPLSPPTAGGGASPGAAGVNDVDHAFTAILGAAGGGGGGGGAATTGGGGGGGAGTVIIHAARDFEIGTNGFIRAYGGQGGAGTGTSGGGGSGGSGSVKIFAGRDITSNNGVSATEVNASQIAGVAGGSGAGGAGGYGRTWVALPAMPYGNFFGLDYVPTEDFFHAPGDVEYAVGTDTFETNTFEIRNSHPIYLSVTSSPVNAGITFLVRASNDNFASDDTGWVAVTDPSLADRRYFKLQISLNNLDANVPLTVDSVTVSYDGTVVNEFNLTGAGCGRVSGSAGGGLSGGASGSGTGLWLLLPFLLLLRVRRRLPDSAL